MMTKTNIGTVTVNNGVASIQLDTTELAEGTYNIITKYNQNDEYTESTGNAELIINSPRTDTMIDLTAPPMEEGSASGVAVVGMKFTVTATITTENEDIINEGEVVFTDKEGLVLGSSMVKNNTAILETKSEKVGSFKVIADYVNAEHYNNSNTSQAFAVSKADVNIEMIPVTVNVGDKLQLKAIIRRAHDNMLIQEGRGSFKLKGSTIKDSNSKVIYISVVNGIIELTNDLDYDKLVLEEWINNPVTINLVYSGSTNYNSEVITSDTSECLIIQS